MVSGFKTTIAFAGTDEKVSEIWYIIRCEMVYKNEIEEGNDKSRVIGNIIFFLLFRQFYMASHNKLIFFNKNFYLHNSVIQSTF